MVCWLVSALCMTAVVTIYFHVQNRPFQNNNLLTYADTFGKVASAALIVPTSEALGQLKWNWFYNSRAVLDFEIFDKASRGPWGAIMLLFRKRGRSLAALGALLIVLLLAIDTFFLSQVVVLSDRWYLDSEAGTLPLTVQYEPNLPKVYRERANMNVQDIDIARVIERFAYDNGTQPVLYANGTRPGIPLDVGSELTYACLAGTMDWTSDLDGGYNVKDDYKNGAMCGYFLNVTSHRPVLMSDYQVNADGTAGDTLLMHTLPLTMIFDYFPFYGNGSINFKSLRDTIADVLIVSANGSTSSVHQGTPPVAQECVLSWCVKTIRSTPSTLDSFSFQTAYENGTDNYYLQNISIDLGKTPSGRTISGFGTLNSSASTIYQGFQNIFPAFTTLRSNSTVPVMRWKTWDKGPPWNRVLDFNPWLAPNNVTRHMERFATAMTNVIRTAPRKIMLSGDAFSTETFTRIRWPWLAFPFALLLLSLIFLVSTIIKTSNDGAMGTWKTSAMPTLIYSLSPDLQRELSPSQIGASASKEGATKVRIKLLPDRGWRV
ncbi:hypothetical protein EK21DRAFT_105939 [Setomelanomma holmii]|uniref:Uncharacterized protein n=1 Tax=Setomelanomma holmii TaxID=210430 RepID=A0A9P4HMC2_9PLEO|nr:hypothetical protein EK21DRAFT_105939 [Setomelanomma holmii]